MATNEPRDEDLPYGEKLAQLRTEIARIREMVPHSYDPEVIVVRNALDRMDHTVAALDVNQEAVELVTKLFGQMARKDVWEFIEARVTTWPHFDATMWPNVRAFLKECYEEYTRLPQQQ